MKKFMLILTLGTVAGFAAAQDTVLVEQQSSDIELSADVGLYSAYVWRGQVLNEGAVAQPGMTVSKGNLSFNLWGNYNLDGKNGSSDTDWVEYDFTLAYRLPEGLIMDGVDLDVGIVKYEYAGSWNSSSNTEELFAAMTLNDIILTPVVTAYYDINEVNGWYWNLALSQPLEVSDVLSFEVGASLGYGSKNYNETYFSEDNGSGAVNDYNVYVSGSYALTEQLSLGALLQYSCLDGGVGDDFEANAGETDNLVWGGVSLSYTF